MRDAVNNIDSKIAKVLELVKRGVDGEQVNANKILQSLCKKYNIDIDSLQNEKLTTRYFIINTRAEKCIFFQCYSKLNITTTVYRRIYKKIATNKYEISLTDENYIALSELYSWHLKQFNKEHKKITNKLITAYINKHDLFSENTPTINIKSMPDMEMVKIIKDGLDDVSYVRKRKRIREGLTTN